MAKTQVFTEANLSLYDQLVKQYIDGADSKSIKSVTISGNTLKFYKISEPVGDSTPAYTITLPEADISGLIPKITGATVGNVVTAKADGTVEDSGIKASDLATKAEVKAVEDAVDILNGADTVEGSVAKSIKDLKTTLDADIATAKASGDNAQTAVDTLVEKVGTVPKDKTVVQMIADSMYDDTAVKASIKANTDAITVLNGSGEGSVSKQVSDAVAAIVADAPEAYDTLKEISDWISNHADDAAAMNSQINTNKTDIASLKALVGTLPEGSASTTVVEYIAEAIGASSTDLTSAIATAKQEAIDTAAADATSKANTAETNAKGYADGLNTAMDTRVASLETKVGEGFEPISESFIRGLFA